jgi:hypothetical protein
VAKRVRIIMVYCFLAPFSKVIGKIGVGRRRGEHKHQRRWGRILSLSVVLLCCCVFAEGLMW